MCSVCHSVRALWLARQQNGQQCAFNLIVGFHIESVIQRRRIARACRPAVNHGGTSGCVSRSSRLAGSGFAFIQVTKRRTACCAGLEHHVNQLSRIVAAVDFSEPAGAAFDQALALSRAHGAVLTAVHAVPRSQPFRWRAKARAALITKLRQLAESSGVSFSVRVERGDPATVILHARSSSPDLIVVGTHQRTGLDRLRSGSVAERVAVQATQPVLIVPAGSTTALARSFGSIVVAVDFTAASNRAL